MGRHKKRGPKRRPKRDYHREYVMSKLNGDRHVGAPDPRANATSHDIIGFKNRIKRRARRGRSLIDRRTSAGRNAVAVQQELIADLGGLEQLSTAKLILVELIARDVYFVDEIDRRIFRTMYKAAKEYPKARPPRFVSILYSYRQSVARNLASNLLALGLEKPPPKVQSLEELLAAEDESEESP